MIHLPIKINFFFFENYEPILNGSNNNGNDIDDVDNDNGRLWIYIEIFLCLLFLLLLLFNIHEINTIEFRILFRKMKERKKECIN